MEKLTYIESNKNYISINYHIIRWCNFNCDYCSDKYSRDWKWTSSINDFDDFIKFIENIHKINPETKIEITLIWWEPLLHKDIFYLIDNLFTINLKYNNSIKIIIASNWFLINKFSKELIKYNKSDFLQLNVSYHFHEYKKYDIKKLFLNQQ